MKQNQAENSIDQIIQAAFSAPEPTTAQLEEIRQRVVSSWKEKPAAAGRMNYQPVLRFGLAIVLAAVITTGAAIGPRNVQAAIRRLLGFIPGIGLVEREEGTRILADPVVRDRNGLIVVVNQAVLNLDRTTIYVQLDGELTANPGECREDPYLMLPDGDILNSTGMQGGGTNQSHQLQVEFAALPQEIDRAELVINCPWGSAGEDQEPWIFALRFIPAGPTFTEHPVNILPTLTASPEPTPPASEEPAEITETAAPDSSQLAVDSISLSLDQLVKLDEGLILYASLRWDPTQYDFIFPGKTVLRSAEGYQLPFSMINPDLHPQMESPNPGEHLLAYQVDTGNYSLPVSLEIDGAIATIPLDEEIQFDVGENPFAGPWTIGKKLNAAGHQVLIIEVDAVTINELPGYEVLFELDSRTFQPSLADPEHPVISAGGGPRGENRFATFLLYENGWPTGQISLHLDSVKIHLDSRWEKSW